MKFKQIIQDAVKQLQSLQKEIQDSMDELEKISPLYENQVMREKEMTKGYVYRYFIAEMVYQLVNFLLHPYENL